MSSVKQTLVLTVIGRDRPGLVGALANAIAAHGGNWEEGRMAHLADQFAGILLVRVPEDAVDAMVGSLAQLGADDTLHVTYEQASGGAGPAEGTLVAMELVGQDHPGIVRDVSHALASLGISIEELRTATRSASMSGEAQFTASARLLLPASVGLDAVRDLLESIANDIVVDVELHPEG
jgi:glycine cleavage system regulatory protein